MQSSEFLSDIIYIVLFIYSLSISKYEKKFTFVIDNHKVSFTSFDNFSLCNKSSEENQ